MRELPKYVIDVTQKLYADAELLSQMAGIYPGDITGEITKNAYYLTVMADILSDVGWDEYEQDYEATRLKVEITVE